jgi:hypothetical protein
LRWGRYTEISAHEIAARDTVAVLAAAAARDGTADVFILSDRSSADIKEPTTPVHHPGSLQTQQHPDSLRLTLTTLIFPISTINSQLY